MITLLDQVILVHIDQLSEGVFSEVATLMFGIDEVHILAELGAGALFGLFRSWLWGGLVMLLGQSCLEVRVGGPEGVAALFVSFIDHELII